MEWSRPDGYLISDEKQRIDLARVHHWLSDESYWATGISLDAVTKSVRGSIALGCFDPQGVQVGFTRLINDGATIGVICDVFVATRSRGLGLGKFLVESALSHPEAQGLRRILLATSDAHDLYRRYGFDALSHPDRWMELRPSSLASNQPA
jgi:GNAT superfamily N-acetyltransferase